MKCFEIDCLLIPPCVRHLTISKTHLVYKLRVYRRNSISSLWCLAVNSLWRCQHLALLESRATFRELNAPCRIWTLYAVERRVVTEFRALCLPMNVLCRSAALLLKCVLFVYIWPEKGVYRFAILCLFAGIELYSQYFAFWDTFKFRFDCQFFERQNLNTFGFKSK